ncbi:MAG: hypothetical protein KAK00_10745, partial [Nanoarchaeota archaeon]|nr:hypothetical protein [Nanoarchaeota archaeon]
DIVVYIRIYNTYPSLMFNSIPTTIRVNSSFTVKSHSSNKGCTPTTCYPSSLAGSPDIVLWTLDPLPIGTYNISINSGFDQRDLSPTISRIINVI